MVPPKFTALLPGLLRCFLLLHPCSIEDGGYHGIPLMAGPLIYWPLSRGPGNLRSPGFVPRGGILDRKLVHDLVIGGAREAFDQMQLFAGTSESGHIREIGGVDHQRVALPMAHRVSLPLADILREMGPSVGGDDAGGGVGF